MERNKKRNSCPVIYFTKQRNSLNTGMYVNTLSFWLWKQCSKRGATFHQRAGASHTPWGANCHVLLMSARATIVICAKPPRLTHCVRTTIVYSSSCTWGLAYSGWPWLGLALRYSWVSACHPLQTSRLPGTSHWPKFATWPSPVSLGWGNPLCFSWEESQSLNMKGGRRQWRPTPVLLPGKSHGRRSLVGCSPWGH